MPTEPREARQSTQFLLLYALAVAGGAVAYVPFLTILLPMRVAALGGASSIAWLAQATFVGALAASVSNIGFGWLSDLAGTRRPWIAAGLVLSCALLLGFAHIASFAGVIGLLVCWQLALNCMLSPLAAWAGDCVPHEQKGLLGGLLSFAPAAGAVGGMIVTLPGLAGADARLALVAAMVAACVAPVLVFGRPRAFPALLDEAPARAAQVPATPRRDVAIMWIARLLVQVCEAALFAFLYYWLRSVDPAMTEARIAQVFGFILLAAVPLAMLAGAWGDRAGRPFAPLPIAALAAAAGLAIMALADGLVMALAGYVVFGLSSMVFLSLHTAQTLRVLPRARTRGRDLGIFNLTNTAPSLVMGWLTLALVPVFGFAGLFAVLAGCAVAAALLLALLDHSA